LLNFIVIFSFFEGKNKLIKKMLRKIYIALLILTLNATISFSGNVDSLISEAQKAQGKEKIELLLKVTWKMRNSAPEKAIPYCQEAIDLADSLKEYYELSKGYSFLGVLYRNLSLFNIAFTYYKHSLEISRTYGFDDQLAYGYNNIGNIYLYQNLPHRAVSYLKKADSLGKKLNNDDIRAYSLQNLGRAYIAIGYGDSAIYYIQKALDIRLKDNMWSKVPVSYKYLADAYKLKGDLKEAMKYYKQAAMYADFDSDVDLLADYSYQMADLYLKLNKPDSALYYAKKSLETAKKVNTLYRLMSANEMIAKVYASKGMYEDAYQYSQEALKYKDEIFGQEVIKGIKSIEFTEEAVKRQGEIKLLEKDLQIRKLESRRQKIFMRIAFVIMFIIIGFSIALFRNYRKIKTISSELKKNNDIIKEQNAELQTQKNKLLEQTELLQATNKELAAKDRVITQSINYAKRILDAMMGSSTNFSKCEVIKEHFIINKPKEIIGGDFFYFNKYEKFTAIVVADSTGHGIPGAFISIISISILKDLLSREEDFTAADVLEDFRKQIKSILRQDTDEHHVKDGVDISLCLMRKEDKILEYSGAYNPLYIIKDKELKVIKATRSTAGFSLKELPFVNHRIPLEEIDRFYMFTDGIIDQLGGRSKFKFTSKRWRELIVNIQELTMQGQKQAIERVLAQWQGSTHQTDDILVMGIELDKNILQNK